MPLSVTNSLSRKKESFTPQVPGEVKMYVCGPTVYGLTHVGNARPVVFFDVVRRFLELSGYKVLFVSNYTDVDDKIINRARQEGKTSLEVSEHYIAEFRKDMDALGVRKPDRTPKVTEFIPQIIRVIEGLIANQMAYVAEDGEVFYAVRKFQGYGKLSGKNIDELLTGVRIQPGERKRDPLDFSLWKPQKAADEPAWDSPWGKGRPGWHIECSAMALDILGETFDIHGGGIDLMHPHHENEIAQSEGYTSKTFARVWLHNNLVSIGTEKMSKSLGNIFLNRDFIEKYSAETLRFLLLSGHYRSPIDFSEKHIRECQAALHRVYTTIRKCEALAATAKPATAKPTDEETKLVDLGDNFTARWKEAMEDDLNTAKVVGQVFEYVRALNGYLDRKGFKPTGNTAGIVGKFLENRHQLSSILNLFGEDSTQYLALLRETVLRDRGLSATDIEAEIATRAQARQSKDWAAADAARARLLEKGIAIQDTPNGTEWDVVFQNP